MVKYLTEDFTGEASMIEYAKKGDPVEVIKEENGMCLVKGKELFHVRAERLSNEKPPLTSIPSVLSKTTRPVKKKK